MPLQPYRDVGQVDPNYMGIGAVQNIQKVRNNDLLNIGKQKELDEFDANKQTREDERIQKSIVSGAKQAMQYINDDEALLRFSYKRKKQLLENKRDPQHTQELITALESGDPAKIQEMKQYLTQIAGAGEEGFNLPEGAQRWENGRLVAENQKEVAPQKRTELTANGKYEFMVDPDGAEIPNSRYKVDEVGGADGPKVPRPLTSEMAAALGIPEEDRSKYQIGSTGEAELLPVPESSGGVKTKPFADMPFEGRTKLGLVTNADKMATLAKPAMFDENGKFKNWKSIAPTSEARNARKQLKEALMNMLRVESGAAIRPEEIEEQAELMMPGWSDHDSTAKLKWSILEQKISSMHTAMTSGYTGLPESMQLGAQGLSGQTNSGNLNFDANGNLIP